MHFFFLFPGSASLTLVSVLLFLPCAQTEKIYAHFFNISLSALTPSQVCEPAVRRAGGRRDRRWAGPGWQHHP